MRKALLPIILIVAFGLRLGYAAASGALRNPQIFEQERITTNLLERHTFLYDPSGGATYLSYTEPLYPFMAAAVYLATGHDRTALVLLQLVIATAMVWVTAYATRLASGDDRAAIAAALLAAVHPGFIRYSTILHPFVLDSLFFIGAAAAIIRYRHQPALRRGVLAAAIIGLGVLTRPTILLFVVPLAWIAWRSSETPRRALLRSALLVLVALAIVSPWTLRNARIHRTFMLTRSGTGLVFWLGNNPMSTGSARDGNVPLERKLPAEFQRQVIAADEVTRDRMYADAAWEYIRARPLAAIGRFLQRVYYFWWFSPQWGAAFSPGAKIVYRAWWAMLFVLIGIGLFAVRHAATRRDFWLMAALALLISLGQSVYYVEGRHRLGIEPLVLPLAAAGVFRLCRLTITATLHSTTHT